MEVYLTIIGIVVTSAVAYSIYFLERRKKSLNYVVLANTSLITLNPAIRGKIKILFDDTHVENVTLFLLEIINDGNVDIEASDFIIPLTIRFTKNTNILSYEVLNPKPENLKPEFKVGTDEIELIPLHIMKKDLFS